MTSNRQRLVLALLLILALGLTGCSDDPAGPEVPETYDHAKSTTAGGLRLTVSTPRATAVFGDDVPVRMTLTNVSDEVQVLDFLRGDPARYSNLVINVDDANGAAHFVDGDGTRDNYRIEPGAAITATFTWDQISRFGGAPVSRGTYQVIGVVAFDDRDPIRVNDLFIMLD